MAATLRRRSRRRDPRLAPGSGRRGAAARLRRGFTLLEVLVAMLILAGGLLTMASVQIQSLKGGQRGRHLTQATAIANSQLEQLQRERWTNIPATAWTAEAPWANAVQQGASTENEQVYQVSYRVTTLTPDKVRAIDVRVRWTETGGQDRSVTMSGIRHNFEAL